MRVALAAGVRRGCNTFYESQTKKRWQVQWCREEYLQCFLLKRCLVIILPHNCQQRQSLEYYSKEIIAPFPKINPVIFYTWNILGLSAFHKEWNVHVILSLGLVASTLFLPMSTSVCLLLLCLPLSCWRRRKLSPGLWPWKLLDGCRLDGLVSARRHDRTEQRVLT